MQASPEELPTSLAGWVDLGSIEEDLKSEATVSSTDFELEKDEETTRHQADASKRPNTGIKSSIRKLKKVKSTAKKVIKKTGSTTESESGKDGKTTCHRADSLKRPNTGIEPSIKKLENSNTEAETGVATTSTRRKRRKSAELGPTRTRTLINSGTLTKRSHLVTSHQKIKRKIKPRGRKLEKSMDLAELCMSTYQWSEDLNRHCTSMPNSILVCNPSEVSTRLLLIAKCVSDSISVGRSELPVLPLDQIFGILKNLCITKVAKSEMEAMVTFLYRLLMCGLVETMSFSVPIGIKDRILQPLIYAAGDKNAEMTKVLVEEVVKRVLQEVMRLLNTCTIQGVIYESSRRERAIEICCAMCELFPLLDSEILKAFSSYEIRSIKRHNILFGFEFDALAHSSSEG